MSQEDAAAGFRKLEMLQEERGAPTETGERDLGKQGEEGRPSAAPSVKPADPGHFPNQQRPS